MLAPGYQTEIDVGLNPDGAVSTLGITNVPWIFFVVCEIPREHLGNAHIR